MGRVYLDKSKPNFSRVQIIPDNFFLQYFEYYPTPFTVSFQKLRMVGKRAFQSCFYLSSLTGTVSFPSLQEIDDYGFYECFYSTDLNGDVYFPALKTIGTGGLKYAFTVKDKITLHFPAALSEHTECTKENTGATEVLFDL